MVVVVIVRGNQTEVWHLGVHKQGVRSPFKVRVIPLVGIVGITIWSIGLLWLELSYSVCTL